MVSPTCFLKGLDSPLRAASSISSERISMSSPSTRAWSPEVRRITSSMTICDWSISTSLPSLTTVTLGLSSKAILSSLRFAFISCRVDTSMLSAIIPVADTALVYSCRR